jgi:HD-GYP domain-containing protein (c-di-GMP phosphodiesterase class II)
VILKIEVIKSERVPSSELPIEERLARLEWLERVGLRLARERNRGQILETVLTEARELCGADGGTLYLRTEDDQLRFALVQTVSLGIHLGHGGKEDEIQFPPLPLYHPDGSPNQRNVATFAAHARRRVHVPDAYDASGFDFSGTKAFDAQVGYRSKSFLTIPLEGSDGRVIGVLQLINATDRNTGEVIPFRETDQDTVESLAAHAALALDSRMLLEAQGELLESFIRLIAAAIDSKSPYTGNHCERVPVLVEMLAEAACGASDGPFADFKLSDEEWYELRIAAWLHDAGKVTTPVHIMDKATKLEAIVDRIAEIRLRAEILIRDEHTSMLEAILAGESREIAEARYQKAKGEIEDDLAVIERANLGGEFLLPEVAERLKQIARRTFTERGVVRPLLDERDLENLLVARGTLTEAERITINGHMVETIRMLEALPFPRHLRRVPEYAGAHHERMDGKGYPKGLYAGDLSIPARMMAIADVFEALTADDRPYKKAKKLSEAMRIMGAMKRDHHLDPELFDLFVRSKTYLRYAEKYLAPDLRDVVDEEALLAIKPPPLDLPSRAERDQRRARFLPEYEARFPRTNRAAPK